MPGGHWSAGPLVVRSSKSGADSPTAGEPNGDRGSAAPGTAAPAIGDPENEEPISDKGGCTRRRGIAKPVYRMG